MTDVKRNSDLFLMQQPNCVLMFNRKRKMSETVFKAPKAKKSPLSLEDDEMTPASGSKRPRTAEDFYLFCTYILEHVNYDEIKQEELREKASSPMGSTGSIGDSIKSESTGSSVVDDAKGSDVDTANSTSAQECYWNGIHFSDEDSYDLVTCYCAKPFAGRAMIECSKCLTWVHLSCAKIKKTNIPEVFICVKCKHHKYHSNGVSRTPSSQHHIHSQFRHKKRVSF